MTEAISADQAYAQGVADAREEWQAARDDLRREVLDLLQIMTDHQEEARSRTAKIVNIVMRERL